MIGKYIRNIFMVSLFFMYLPHLILLSLKRIFLDSFEYGIFECAKDELTMWRNHFIKYFSYLITGKRIKI